MISEWPQGTLLSQLVIFFKTTPTLVASIGVTIAHGPLPKPTTCTSPIIFEVTYRQIHWALAAGPYVAIFMPTSGHTDWEWGGICWKKFLQSLWMARPQKCEMMKPQNKVIMDEEEDLFKCEILANNLVSLQRLQGQQFLGGGPNDS